MQGMFLASGPGFQDMPCRSGRLKLSQAFKTQLSAIDVEDYFPLASGHFTDLKSTWPMKVLIQFRRSVAT